MALDKSAFAESLRTMPILELKALVDGIEKVFGSVGSRASVLTQVVEKAVEKTDFNITFTSTPSDKKIAAIKLVREILGLGLKEAKDFVDGLPKVLKEGISKDEAEKIKVRLTEIGGTVEIN